MTYEMTYTKAATLRRIERILEIIAKKPSSAKEIAEQVHLNHSSVYGYLNHLRESGKIRIVSWKRREPRGGSYEAQYLAGGGVDADKPDPLPANVVYQRRVRRLKSEGLYEMTMLVPRRKPRKAKPDPLVAAFYGIRV